jgi:hypothetical protein
MNGVYKSLKWRVQQRSKTDPMPVTPDNADNVSTLSNEMARLEASVTESVARLKAAVDKSEALVADETKQAGHLVESFELRIAELEAQLAEAEETVRSKDLSRQQNDETLAVKINQLQDDVNRKEQAWAARDEEINQLKRDKDGQLKQIGELERAIEKAKQEAAGYDERAKELAETSQLKIAALESRLAETEELARKRESVSKELEQKLAAKVQAFETLVKEKQELLAGRDSVISDLKSQLQVLTTGIGEMSSLFRKAEVLAGITGKGAGAAFANAPQNGRRENHDAVQANGANAPKNVPAGPGVAREIVAPEFLQHISVEFAEVAGLLQPLAMIFLRECATALGESVENFPRRRIPELLESLAREISDEQRQMDFRQRMAQNRQISQLT